MPWRPYHWRMKKHIVILSAFLTPLRSGAEACVEEVPPFLKDEYDCTIITARMRKDLPVADTLPSGVPVIRIGIGRSIDKWVFPFLAPFAAKKLQPDVIHAVLESFAGLALVLCTWINPRARRILTCQSTNTSFLVGLMHRSADTVTAISSVLIERAKRFGRSDAVLIPNGIPLAAIRSATKSEKRVTGRILYVGRLEPMKGVATLLDAFAMLAKEFPSAHLHIVGDGSLRASLEARQEELVAEQRIVFRGYLPPLSVYAAYATADIFCALSRSEALGNVFLEASASGCTIIATNVGGIPDIVKDNETGLLVAPSDPDAAAAALRNVLSDATLRHRLAHAAGQHAAGYDWSVIAKKYKEVYQNIPPP